MCKLTNGTNERTDGTLSKKTIWNWFKEFSHGRRSDELRENNHVTSKTIDGVQQMTTFKSLYNI